MKSARSIKMDYNAMLQKAGSLEASQSAQGVRRAAKRMYDTEMFALSLFSRR